MAGLKRRKKSSGGGANWMDTYGDMVTLLLCFFVLLYSMSTISEDNWRAIVMSFNPNAAMAPTESEGHDGPVADPEHDVGLDKGLQAAQEEIEDTMQALYQALSNYLEEQDAENQNLISVTQGDGKVFITFNQAVFFAGDSAVLRSEAYPILDNVCELLDDAAGAINEVRVLGHTAQASSNRPNDVAEDRLLSSERATNVVIYVQQHCSLSPSRLVSEGMGQWRPVASNDTPEERAKNRRVEMIISGRNLEQELSEDIKTYETEAESPEV